MKLYFYDASDRENVEFIKLESAANGKYFVTYSYGKCPCVSGPFNMFCDALNALRSCRPKAHVSPVDLHDDGQRITNPHSLSIAE